MPAASKYTLPWHGNDAVPSSTQSLAHVSASRHDLQAPWAWTSEYSTTCADAPPRQTRCHCEEGLARNRRELDLATRDLSSLIGRDEREVGVERATRLAVADDRHNDKVTPVVKMGFY